jgi:hypothetical protein
MIQFALFKMPNVSLAGGLALAQSAEGVTSGVSWRLLKVPKVSLGARVCACRPAVKCVASGRKQRVLGRVTVKQAQLLCYPPRPLALLNSARSPAKPAF